MRKIKFNFSFHQPLQLVAKEHEENIESKIEIVSEKTLSSFALERCLKHRRIPLEIAKDYCKEETYKSHDREYYGIGFKTMQEVTN